MIYMYGISFQGADHKKTNTVCQDANRLIKHSDNVGIIAIADGLGSAKYSDAASNIAVKVSAKHCNENINPLCDDEKILTIIRSSFHLAQDAIEFKASENNHNIAEYDTTLTLAIMIKDSLYYGHSGDGGIIILAADGAYYQETKQQRDENGNVFPLWFREDKWVFKKAEKKVSSVLLATDGMLATFSPIFIRDQPVNINVPLAMYFMDNSILKIDKSGEENIKECKSDFIVNIDESIVSDDKTIAVMLNTDIETETQAAEYYQEPDWETLINEWRSSWAKAAYPELFENTEE